MTSHTGNPFPQCLCCTECQDDLKGFQKILDLKNIGLVIYHHLVEVHDKKLGEIDNVNIAEDVFIIENTNDQEITSAQYSTEIGNLNYVNAKGFGNQSGQGTEDICIKITRETPREQNKISCPRCQKIVEHAQRLLHTIPNIDKNVVRGICDHCLREQKTCCVCEKIIQKFLTRAKELPENTKHFIKEWLSKVKHVLKSIAVDDNVEDYKPRKTNHLSVDRLSIDQFKSSIQSRKPNAKQLYFPQTQKTVTIGQRHDQIISLEKRQVDQPAAHAEYKYYVKEKRLKILQFTPPVPMQSREKLLERSFEHLQPPVRPKSWYSILKPDDMEQLGTYDQKSRIRHYLRKSRSDESLLTITEVISTDTEIKKDFSYFFPKITKPKFPKRFASSSELIKETRDILQDKAEVERKKREIKELLQLNFQAKKEQARAERKLYLRGKTSEDKNKFSKDTRDGVTSKHFITQTGQRGQKQDVIKEELSSATIRGVYKKDDKSDIEDKTKGEMNKKKPQNEYKEKIQPDKNQSVKEISSREKVDERQPKEQKQKERYDKEKSGKVKTDESSSKDQKAKDKKGEEKHMQAGNIQKVNKETTEKTSDKKGAVEKSTETSAKKSKKIDNQVDLENDRGQQLKQDQKGKKGAADLTKQQKDGKSFQDQKQNDGTKKTTTGEDEEVKVKIQRDTREPKETVSAKAKDALFAQLGENKQPKDKETRVEKINKDKEEKSGSNEKASRKTAGDKTGGKKSSKSKKGKSPTKKLSEKEVKETPSSDNDIAPKGKKANQKSDLSDEGEVNLDLNKVKVRSPSNDDLIMRLVKLKQSAAREKKGQQKKETTLVELKAISKKIKKHHKGHKHRDEKCIMCIDSDFEFDLDHFFYAKTPEICEIIIGTNIYKHTATPHNAKIMEEEKLSHTPLLFQCKEKEEPKMKIDPQTVMLMAKGLRPGSELPAEIAEGRKNPQKSEVLSKKKGNQALPVGPDPTKGVVHYTLSDRSFIEKGWTMLPTEKIVRKMNVYRMRPAQPEFDWFEHNRTKGQMTYDTGEILADFNDNGRGRWFYRNGRLALDYYDAEEMNASQRFVVWSSGEPDERGRARPYTILATFDYLGNGIVFDHTGKIRLKYNQTEGIVLDRKIGPVSHWKWHTLNDPPVLQQVMIDTQMTHKDPNILKLPGDNDKSRPDNEQMLAIEFDNFIKEKSKKLTQTFKPFQIKMKALKINECFSLRVIDQASVYLIFRDGTTNLKMNLGMVLDHKEIVDTDTAELGEVSNNVERLPARTESIAGIQKSVEYAQCLGRMRSAREKRIRLPQPVASADKLTAAVSRPLRPPLRSIASDSFTTITRTGYCCSRKPHKNNIYYDNRLF